MTKIAFAMTVPSALRVFMADHIRALSRKYEVTVFCNFSTDRCDDLFDPSVTLINIPFQRKIRILSDLQCLIKLTSALARGRFESIHSLMPKTGLLSMTAGWLSRTPVRIHMFTGQVWVTRSGPFRVLLKSIDRITSALATATYADSPSQRDFLVEQGIIKNGTVIGEGSVNGVDCNRFRPDPGHRIAIREQFGIPAHAVVFGFVGRMTKDKGIPDLVEAFTASEVAKHAHLLLVGPDEENLQTRVHTRFPDRTDRIHFIGYTSEPERFYSSFDVFCLPSYREGFGSSVIEAAACGVPALASRIYGLTDAVVDRETGILHEAGNVSAIREGMERYVNDSSMRSRFSLNARQRVLDKFATDTLVEAMVDEYEKLVRVE